MNISVTLRRGPDGRLRPNIPEPTTLKEIEQYKESQLLADEADKFLSSRLDQFARVAALDNGQQDLNSRKGLVVISEPWKQDPRDRMVSSEILEYDVQSGEALSYKAESTGLTARLPKKDSKAPVTFETAYSTLYNSQPLRLECELDSQQQGNPDLWHTEQRHLRETSDGLYEYWRKVDDPRT